MSHSFSEIPVSDVKSYWDNRPCNLYHSNKTLGSREYFDEVEVRKYKVEPHIPDFANFTAWKDKTVLEIGCGIGTDSINFARTGAKLSLTELSENSLNLCRKRFEVFGLKAKFYLANAEKLSDHVPVETYDLVYAFGVIHHSPHPERIVQEIKKYLGPDSECRIMLYSKYSTKNFLIWLGLMQPEAQAGCPIAYTYDFSDVKKLFYGFEIISIEKTHIFPYKIKAYKKYEYEKSFPWNILPGSIFHWFEKQLGWHTLIRVKLRTR